VGLPLPGKISNQAEECKSNKAAWEHRERS
jgi:hypothetical protein